MGDEEDRISGQLLVMAGTRDIAAPKRFGQQMMPLNSNNCQDGERQRKF